MYKLIVMTCLFSYSYAQYFTIKAGLGSSFHFDDGINLAQNGQYDYRNRDLPTIFDDGTSSAFSIMYNFIEDDEQLALGHFQVGLFYSQSKTRSKALVFDFLGWGDHFDLSTFAPFVGYSFYFPGGNKKGKYYLNIGYSYTDYKGLNKSKFSFFDTEYLSSKSLYANLGLSLEVYKGLGLDYSISMMNAKIIPKNLYESVNGPQTQSKLAQGFLSDPFYSMHFALFYTL